MAEILKDHIPVKDIGSDVDVRTSKYMVMDRTPVSCNAGRCDVEDKLHQLMDENLFLKKHSRKLEDRVKQSEARLSKLTAEKRYSGKREILNAEENKHRVIELEYQVGNLKDRLQVAKQQLVSYTRFFPAQKGGRSGKSRASNSSSATTTAPSHGWEIPEQFEILLLEARTENEALEGQIEMLRNQVRSLERELVTTKELTEVKEVSFVEELNVLRNQVDAAEHAKQKLVDNIQLIRLQRDSRRAAGWLATLEAQCKSLEANLASAQENNQELESQLNSVQEELREAQQQNLELQRQVDQGSGNASRVKELEALVVSLKEENNILKELNASIESKTLAAIDKIQKLETDEGPLRTKIAQVESRLIAELQTKSEMYSVVNREQAKVKTLTEQLEQALSKTKSVEELKNENVPVQTHSALPKASREASTSMELAETTRNVSESSVIRTSAEVQEVKQAAVVPKYEETTCRHCSELESDLKETRSLMVNLKDDLVRTKSMLKSEMTTNRAYQREVELLSLKIGDAESMYRSKLEEFSKTMDNRTQQIAQLETNVFALKEQQASQSIHIPAPAPLPPSCSVQLQTPPTPTSNIETQTSNLLELSGAKEPRVEIFLDKFVPRETESEMLKQGLFATWSYGEDGTKYTPVVRNGVFSSGSSHPVLRDELESQVEVQLHKAVGPADCETVGIGKLVLGVGASFCSLVSCGNPGKVLGELHYAVRTTGSPPPAKVVDQPHVNAMGDYVRPAAIQDYSRVVNKPPEPKPRPQQPNPPKPRVFKLQTESAVATSEPAEPHLLAPKPILRRDTSPDTKRSKKVTLTEIVEERRFSSTSDEDEFDFFEESQSSQASQEVPPEQEQTSGPKILQPEISASAGEEAEEPDSEATNEETTNESSVGQLHEETEEQSSYTSSAQEPPNSIRIHIHHMTFSSPCRFWSDPKVHKLYVEYRFLDFAAEEMETPKSVAKPQPGKKAEFDFAKTFQLSSNQRALLKSQVMQHLDLEFTVVSEPPENDSLDCEDIGFVQLPYEDLGKKNLKRQEVPLYDAQNSRQRIGSLCVSIEAADVIKML